REVARRTAAALAAVGIAELAERDPRRLSGGQMQLVAVAGLLAMRPPHLVLDEPTAQLDPAGKRLVADALRRLAADGTALLIAEHDTDLLAALCSRIVVIAGGRLVSDGATAEVLADARLEQYGVEPPARVRLGRAVCAAGLSVELPA
ncbi:MAG TPA: ATP-binding cassette domain-containing protein, partial [Candidatus Limnocylindria bacterium]|nr:ATP-binding cassette domain-containing protein [Candidatus Limnocylindria bacterium]